MNSKFYESERFITQCIKGANTKKKSGFYSFEESQKRNKKACETRRDNGYYSTERFREARLKSERTKKDRGYYNSKEFQLNHKKTTEARRLNNKVYQRPVIKICKKTKRETLFNNYYEAAESIKIPAYVVSEVIRGKRKSSKGFIFKVVTFND